MKKLQNRRCVLYNTIQDAGLLSDDHGAEFDDSVTQHVSLWQWHGWGTERLLKQAAYQRHGQSSRARQTSHSA